MTEKYPGFESSNPEYYDQFDNSIEKVHSEPIQIEWGVLKFWRWKYELVKQQDVRLNSELKSLLSEEGIISFYLEENREKKQFIPNIKKLVFYNKRLHQGQVLYVPYVRVDDKVFLLWVIHQNIIHKFPRPIEKTIGEEKIYKEIWRILWCKNCMLKHRWNEIDFYEIINHQKVKHFKLFGFIKGEMIYDKHTEKIFRGKILFDNFWNWIVINSKWKIVYQIQRFWDISVIKDRNWRILGQLSEDNVVSFNIPETGEKVALKIAWD